MNLNFKISNTNSGKYSNIMLRKFFQIVFWGNDKKSLNIYTATVLSGCNEYSDPKGYISFNNNESTPNSKDFEIPFEFNQNKNENDIADIKFIDCTDSFLNQMPRIQEVWGEQCTSLENQTEVNNRLTYIFSDRIKIDNSRSVVHESDRMTYIDQENKKDRILFQSIAIKGELRTKSSKKYAIATHVNNIHPGFELINWIKTTITFKKRISETNLIYSIAFDDKCETTYLTPDFTLYFAPPTWTKIDCDNANVIVNKDKFSNLVAQVANKTTIYFDEWVLDEKIQGRNKSRVLMSKVFDGAIAINGEKHVSIHFDIIRKEDKAVRQFFYGILASSVIAFGIDYTRLRDFSNMFPPQKFIPPDISWIIYIILFLLTLTTQLPEHYGSIDKTVKGLRKLRSVGILVSCVWFLVTFWLSNIDIVYPGYYFQIICKILYSGSIFINMVYFTWSYRNYRDELFSWLF